MAPSELVLPVQSSQQSVSFDWLPCSVGCDHACARDGNFSPEPVGAEASDAGQQQDGHCRVHLRGRELVGVVLYRTLCRAAGERVTLRMCRGLRVGAQLCTDSSAAILARLLHREHVSARSSTAFSR